MEPAAGFWQETCLPASEGGDGLVGVQVGWGEELDGVDAVVGEDVVVAGVDAGGDAPLAGAELGALGNGVAESGDLAAVVGEVAGGVELGDGAAADYGEADFLHGGFTLSPSLPPARERGYLGPLRTGTLDSSFSLGVTVAKRGERDLE